MDAASKRLKGTRDTQRQMVAAVVKSAHGRTTENTLDSTLKQLAPQKPIAMSQRGGGGNARAPWNLIYLI